jgi:integrase/recombinase XerD
VAWLQLPPAGRAGEVAVLPSVVAEVSVSTVNRKLAAVSAFCAALARPHDPHQPQRATLRIIQCCA